MTQTQPTIKQATASHPLAPAVLRQLGGGADAVSGAIDAARHGADGGFHGFIYYTDTIRFARRNRAAIAEAVESLASDIGEDPLALVKGFGCFQNDPPSNTEIAHALYGGGPRESDGRDLVENALAWFALEEVGHAIESLSE